MLPRSVREDLERQLAWRRRLHERDLARGVARVELPDALERKYPRAAQELGWGAFSAHSFGDRRRPLRGSRGGPRWDGWCLVPTPPPDAPRPPVIFQPDEATHTLRDYVRQRANHVRLSGQHIQRMQKALELMNLKLTQVLGDLTGVTTD
jgi:hypothetical protein